MSVELSMLATPFELSWVEQKQREDLAEKALSCNATDCFLMDPEMHFLSSQCF